MRKSTNTGFSLIEAVVVIAIMAILAGAAVPLLIKAVNQQREQRTRSDMKVAWEAMFGARDRRVVNMRADFGFDPQVNPVDFRFLTNRTGLFPLGQTPPLYGYDIAGKMFWGWNGPYWVGSVQTSPGFPGGLPVDGWGHPFQLVYNAGNYQLVSGGVDGLIPPPNNADNIVYPSSPMPLSALNSNLTLNVWNKTSTLMTEIKITVQSKGQWNVLPAPFVYLSCLPTAIPHSTPPAPDLPLLGLNTGGSIRVPISNLLPGPVSISVVRTAPVSPSPTTTDYTADLLPGEGRVVDLVID